MSPIKKKGLGRGLSALFGDETSKKTVKNDETNRVAISDLIRNPYQPRQTFNEAKLNELANSIKKNGIIQPIAVRPNTSEAGKYEIVAGERRWLAAQKAGLHDIPVTVLDLSDVESLEVAIVENIQRQDLNSIEEAESYQKLIDKFDYDHEKVAKFIGKSRSHITNCLRLLTLPKNVIELIESNQLSQGHAKILVGLENAHFLAKKIIQKNLSVRQSETLVKIFRNKKVPKNILKDPNLKSLELSIIEKTGLNVFIKNKKNNSGSISFEYKDLEQLNRLLEVIKANY